MNPHNSAGSHGQPNMPLPHYSRRQQEYHHYQQHGYPQSPNLYNPYAYQYPPQYYGQPVPPPYPMPRWVPQQSYPQYSMPPQMHNPQRSPMIVSSQPHVPYQQQASRPHQYQQHSPTVHTSPYATSHITPSAPSLPISSPRDVPSTSTTPQPASRRASSAVQSQSITRMPFYPSLPWYSHEDGEISFPSKARRKRRRYRFQDVGYGVLLPFREDHIEEEPEKAQEVTDGAPESTVHTSKGPEGSQETTPILTEGLGSEIDNTPALESKATGLTPSVDTAISSTSQPMANGGHRRVDTRPAIPVIPALPHKAISKPATAATIPDSVPQAAEEAPVQVNGTLQRTEDGVGTDGTVPASPTVVKSIPKSWADLVRSKGGALVHSVIPNGNASTQNTAPSRSDSIGEVLDHFDLQNGRRSTFLEPRGLVNTGNMCYMNSVLQVLIACTPFYDFLDQVGKRAAHSFKSDTPLVDALIMFMREFKVIDSAESADRLRLRLKDKELEQYGDPLIPEYVYSAINRLPRFSSMRRGHQQDAEEFLGFLLAGLHDECVAVMRSSTGQLAPQDPPQSPASTASQATDGWLEVGRKQKAAITRQSGDPTATTPISKIFGGTLRSELRVPGLKNSVTLEPYQPLQLDIGSPTTNNITEALKALTKPESLVGEFNSPRGPGTTATKQVFIESLPPVLILHLKRFQYDSSGGTQKIWKRVGYPLEFEVPKEVFPPNKRGALAVNGGSPRYRLISVVYHHGKSAAGGHYTVDLLRQDRKEWVRIDDTFIRRVRSEDVAEGGAEEDPKILAKALERHQQEQESSQRNPYEGLDGDASNEDDGKAWSSVNGSDKKRWAGVAAAGPAAGSITPSTVGKQTPRPDNLKDNKVAYILLYERISP